jgi:hypothetical protein
MYGATFFSLTSQSRLVADPYAVVGSKPFRLDPEGRLGTLDHCPRRPDLGLPDDARGFDMIPNLTSMR